MNTKFSLFGMHMKLCILFYHKTGPHHNCQAGWRLKEANGPGDLSHKRNKCSVENAEFCIEQELFHSCFLLQLVVG